MPASTPSAPAPETATETASDPRVGRYALFPIVHHNLWKLYKQAVASFWTVEEIDMSTDVKQWETAMTADERYFVEQVLGFFANVDQLIMHNISASFLERADEFGLPPEATMFYSYQTFNESIHAETYNVMIQALVREKARQLELFNSVTRSESVAKIARWIGDWVMAPEIETVQERIVGMCAVEAIMFSAAFCAIYWLKKRGLCPGLTFANELIARDEGLHASFASELLRTIGGGDPAMIRSVVASAMETQLAFVDECLPIRLIGMNADQMKQYCRYVADRLLLDLGVEKMYGDANPFEWMEQISLQGKTNFFERRVGEYQKAGVMAGGKDVVITPGMFAGDADF